MKAVVTIWSDDKKNEKRQIVKVNEHLLQKKYEVKTYSQLKSAGLSTNVYKFFDVFEVNYHSCHNSDI